MTQQQEQVQEALRHVANLRRTLAIARQVRDNAFNMALAMDVVSSLAKQLQAAELDAARLIGPAGHTLHNGGHMSVSRDDRRHAPRPRFAYRHTQAATVTA